MTLADSRVDGNAAHKENVPLATCEEDLAQFLEGYDTVDCPASQQRRHMEQWKAVDFIETPTEESVQNANNNSDVEDGAQNTQQIREPISKRFFQSKSFSTRAKSFNANSYAGKKTVTQGMLDIALLSANSSYLKLLCQQYLADQEPHFFWILVVMLSLSITMQLFTAFLLFFKLKYNINREDHQGRAEQYNNIATILVIVITALNVLIASFSSGTPAVHQQLQENDSVLGMSGTRP